MAPQILMIDGKEITKSERILATQKLEDLKLELLTEIELQKIKSKNKQSGNLRHNINFSFIVRFFFKFFNQIIEKLSFS